MKNTYFLHQEKRQRRFIFAIIVLALLIRVTFVFIKIDFVNSDEAIIGIMAKDIVKGEYPIFYYGQSYYVPWESYLAAPIVKHFGLNKYSIRVIPILVSIATCIVFYHLGNRIGGNKTAIGSALVSAFPPLSFLSRQMKGDAAFSIVLLLGTLLLVLLIDYSEDQHLFKLPPIGILIFIGLGSHPIMGYYAITAFIIISSQWISQRYSKDLDPSKDICYLLLIIGLILFLAAATFFQQIESIFSNILFFIKDTLPILMGFYSSTSYSAHQREVLKFGIPLLVISILASIIAIMMFLMAIYKGRDNTGVRILTVYTIVVLVIFSLFVVGTNSTKDVYTKIRFIFPIYSILPLFLFSLSKTLHSKNPLLEYILVGGIILFHIGGYISYKPRISSLNILSNFLLDNRINSIYINYWDGYRLAFKTNEEVIPYIINNELNEGHNRIIRYKESVNHDNDPAYILKNKKSQEKFEKHLERNDIQYEKKMIGEYSIYMDLIPELKNNYFD